MIATDEANKHRHEQTLPEMGSMLSGYTEVVLVWFWRGEQKQQQPAMGDGSKGAPCPAAAIPGNARQER